MQHAARIVFALGTVFLTAACAQNKAMHSVGTAPSNKVWARADGQRMAGNPGLMRQGQADLTQCRALAAIGDKGQHDLKVLNGCMTARGYVERDL